MSRHPMSSADAAWLRMDRPQNLMAITSVLWFERPIEPERLREVLRERLVERFPRFRQRVVDGGALGGARWEDDPGFDLDLHLHRVALPPPADEAALQAYVADLMAMPLDRTKPLWHVHLVEGYGGGCALVTRMHHCIADGIALARVMFSLTDEVPEGSPPPGIAAPVRGHPHLARAAGPIAPAFAAGRAVAGTLAHEGAETLLHPTHATRLVRDAAGVARAMLKELATLPDPRGPLRGDLRPGERVAWSWPVPLEQLKAIGREQEATINDVVVSAVTGALRGWMATREPVDHEIHAMVPFNLRALEEELPRDLGNHFGLVLLKLPLLEDDPLHRLHEVTRRMRAIKDSPEGAVSYGVIAAMGLAPPPVEARLLDFFSSKASLVLTNVPGPPQPVYLAGSRLRGVLVWAPCAANVSTSVSVFSYDGALTVGFMTDPGLVPHPQELVERFHGELAALAQRTQAQGVS